MCIESARARKRTREAAAAAGGAARPTGSPRAPELEADVVPAAHVEDVVEGALDGERHGLGAGHAAGVEEPPVAVAEARHVREDEDAVERLRQGERVAEALPLHPLHAHVQVDAVVLCRADSSGVWVSGERKGR